MHERTRDEQESKPKLNEVIVLIIIIIIVIILLKITVMIIMLIIMIKIMITIIQMIIVMQKKWKHVLPNIMNFTCELNYMSHRLYVLFRM